MRALIATLFAVFSSFALAENVKTVTDNSFGCTSEEAFSDARSYLSNHEFKLLESEFTSGRCVMLRKGQQVVLVDVAMLSHAIVRIPGEPTKLYTFFTTLR